MGTASPSAVTPQRIMQMAWGFALPLAIQAAVNNHIFDTLTAGNKTLDEIADQAHVAKRGLPFLLNLLVEAGLLAVEGGRYALTPESEIFLVSSSPAFHGAFFAHIQDLITHWLGLPDAIRTGQPRLRVESRPMVRHFLKNSSRRFSPPAIPPHAHWLRHSDWSNSSSHFAYSTSAQAPASGASLLRRPLHRCRLQRSTGRMFST